LAEVFVEFTDTVSSEDGKTYTARACGSEMPDGKWQGWIEFVPLGGGDPFRSSRETTQPNRQDTEYWATGLTPVYLEGALHRALNRPVRLLAREIAPPRFAGPADNFILHDGVATGSVLDPFSVYRKGEALLRRQLSALAGWHLVNIIRRYNLASEGVALNERESSQLVELIVSAVRNPQQVSS
jgi:hypothetical protein